MRTRALRSGKMEGLTILTRIFDPRRLDGTGLDSRLDNVKRMGGVETRLGRRASEDRQEPGGIGGECIGEWAVEY